MNEFDDKARGWDTDEKRRRAETVAARIREIVPLRDDMAAFEYGCGTGLLSFALQPYLGDITLADSSAGMLEVAREKIAQTNASGMSPLHIDLAVDPVPDERYDLVYTLMTLHHVRPLERVLANLATLLLPGGYLCIADLDTEDGSFHGEQFDGHHGFDRRELGEKLTRLGLQVDNVDDCFTMTKETAAGQRSFSVFLLVAHR
ncbi:MAG: methyltransferase domain-containing protein [Chitinivibrionales bacterium]|nr:methyltransferase domain-containing protein [Chitinivibrionales bacterium]